MGGGQAPWAVLRMCEYARHPEHTASDMMLAYVCKCVCKSLGLPPNLSELLITQYMQLIDSQELVENIMGCKGKENS